MPDVIAPLKKLLICTTPRTASNTFMHALTAAGLGVPVEYFNSKSVASFCDKWKLPGPTNRNFDCAKYVDELMIRQQRNSVFAAKLQFQQFEKYLLNPLGLGLFDGAVVVHLVRLDLVGQAASYLAAYNSGAWGENPPGAGLVNRRIRPGSLLKVIDMLASHDMNWRRFFALANIKPIFLTDQDIIENPVEIITRIAKAIGVDVDLAKVLPVAKAREKYTVNADIKQAILHQELPSVRQIAFRPGTYATERRSLLLRLGQAVGLPASLTKVLLGR